MPVQFSVMPLPGGGFVTTVLTRSEGAQGRLHGLLESINQDAFDPLPVPHSLAEAMLRDGVIPPATVEALPPNCEGHHAAEAPMPPFDPLQDDDEGPEGETPRFPPGVACNVTGGCEE